MQFRGAAPKPTRPATLEELYKELPRMRGAVPGLWLHQGDVLRAYLADHEKTPDLALELPTGTGKTLPGLVVAEWVRREGAGPVAYACPTNQLARQVLATAEREGVPAVLLVGYAGDWPTADEAAYDSGRAIAVTNYNTVFNSSPKLGDPRLIVFDDAHAGEQFVAEQYAVNIRRHRYPDAYRLVLAALSPLLSGLLRQRLEEDSPDPGAHHQVRLLVPALAPDVLARLDEALPRLPSPLNFQVAMIRNGLESCLVYLSYGGIQIRPGIPPTFENAPFSRARQRVYLSATLGAGGELERAFGRSPIERLPLPDGAQPRSGRRFFVFPELAAGDDPDALVRRLVAQTGKAVVLTQDTVEGAQQTAAWIAPAGVPVLGKADVEHSLDVFAKAPSGVLGLANRYDGLDLPHEACRMVVLDGLPNAHSLQERWLGERADAGAALAERVRTRVVQGAGRCTRGPDDFAVVVVRGSDLTRYLNRPDVRAALDPELQAEVEFGWENSAGRSHDEIGGLVEVFLEHDDAWRTGGEPLVAQARRDAMKIAPPGSEGLQASVDAEVRAWELAYQSDFTGASTRMQEAAREVGKGGDAARGYRAFLLYLAAAWLSRGATSTAEHARARELLRDAAAATPRGQWLREATPLREQERDELPAADQIGVAAVAAAVGTKLNPTKLAAANEQMIQDLSQDEHKRYERGLAALGTLLGAHASKPAGSGRCDSAWEWGTAIWATVEAKSEQGGGGKTLPLHDIRQANTQLDQLAHDRGAPHPPPGSPAIIVSDRLTVAPNDAAAAAPNLHLTGKLVVSALAVDARAAWDELVATAAGQPAERLREHVTDIMRQFGCLPSQALERLTEMPIRPVR